MDLSFNIITVPPEIELARDRVFRELALEASSVDSKKPSGLRHVTLTVPENPLDVLPFRSGEGRDFMVGR